MQPDFCREREGCRSSVAVTSSELFRSQLERQAGSVRADFGLHGLVRDRQLVAFVLLAVGLSWAWWVPVALTGGTASHFPGLLGHVPLVLPPPDGEPFSSVPFPEGSWPSRHRSQEEARRDRCR
jgi:hypothetical protein